MLLDEVGSTIDEAWSQAASGAAEGLLVLAETQSQGRGRAGRRWHSPPGAGIWLSLLLRPGLGWERLGLLPLAAGVAVARACERLGAGVHLKWPNDLVAPDGTGRKLGGILAESRSGDGGPAIVLSIGLDVNADRGDFPSSLAGRIASLAEVAGRPMDRTAVLREILRELEGECARLAAGEVPEIVAEWRRRSSMLGRRVRLAEGVAAVQGVAQDVREDGALVVRLASGAEVVVRAGEVEVLWQTSGPPQECHG